MVGWTAEEPLLTPSLTATVAGDPEPPESLEKETPAVTTAVEDGAVLHRKRRYEQAQAAALAKKQFWEATRRDLQNIANQELKREHLGGHSDSNDPLDKLSVFTAAYMRSRAQVAAKHVRQRVQQKRYMLDPKDKRILAWDQAMTVIILYRVLVMPWRVAFNSPATGGALPWEAIMSIAFAADVVLHFVTGYYEQGSDSPVLEQRTVAVRYLKSWFLIDALAAVPLDTMLRPVVGHTKYMLLEALRGLRLFKLMSVSKITVGSYEMKPVAFSILKTLLIVVLTAHLLSCLWFYVACYHIVYGPESRDPANHANDWTTCGTYGSTFSNYLASFYFIIYTMMTVGYGDIHAVGQRQMVLAIFIQLIGATLFGFIVAATRRIMQFIGPIEKANNRNLQEIADYVIDRRLTDGLSARLKRHFRYYYFKTSVFKESAILADIPQRLCARVRMENYGHLLQGMSLLDTPVFTQDMLLAIATHLKPMECNFGDIITHQGAVPTELYMVVKGRVEAYYDEKMSANDAKKVPVSPSSRKGDASSSTSSVAWTLSGKRRKRKTVESFVGIWGPGSHFGLTNLLPGGCKNECTFYSAAQTDLLWIEQADFLEVLAQYEELLPYFTERSAECSAAISESLAADVVKNDGVNIKGTLLIDFKPTTAKQQLKHTDAGSLCLIGSVMAGSRGGNSMTNSGISSSGHFAKIRAVIQGARDYKKQAVRAVRTALHIPSRGGTAVNECSSMDEDEKEQGGVLSKRLIRTWSLATGGVSNQAWNVKGKIVPGVTELEELLEDLNTRGIVLPDQLAKIRWNLFIAAIVALQAIAVPLEVAFAQGHRMAFITAIEVAVSVVFALDMLLTLRTAYEALDINSVMVCVTVPRMIITRYATTWLIVDAMSVAPVYLLPLASSSWRILRSLQLVRTLKLKQVGRLLRQLDDLRVAEEHTHNSNKSSGLLSSKWNLNRIVPRSATELMKVFAVIYYSAHVFGCIWWLAGLSDRSSDSWWLKQDLGRHRITASYLASIYWALTTITTVGYGDITPSNDLQRAVACVTMLCGTTLFSYIIGAVSELAQNPTGGAVRRSGTMQVVNNYLIEQGIVGRLKECVHAHMTYLLRWRSAYDEGYILSRVPSRLRTQVLLQIHPEAMTKIPIFTGRDAVFVAAVLQHLRPHLYEAGGSVYESGKHSQGIYFVIKGVAEAYTPLEDEGFSWNSNLLAVIPPGKFFGYTARLAAALQEDVAVRALTNMQVYLLSDASSRHMIRYQPALANELQAAIEDAIYRQAKEEMTAAAAAKGGRKAAKGMEDPSKSGQYSDWVGAAVVAAAANSSRRTRSSMHGPPLTGSSYNSPSSKSSASLLQQQHNSSSSRGNARDNNSSSASSSGEVSDARSLLLYGRTSRWHPCNWLLLCRKPRLAPAKIAGWGGGSRGPLSVSQLRSADRFTTLIFSQLTAMADSEDAAAAAATAAGAAGAGGSRHTAPATEPKTGAPVLLRAAEDEEDGSRVREFSNSAEDSGADFSRFQGTVSRDTTNNSISSSKAPTKLLPTASSAWHLESSESVSKLLEDERQSVSRSEDSDAAEGERSESSSSSLDVSGYIAAK